MSGARKRIVELTRSGKYTTMTCVADAAGVGCEYVRQVLNESEEFDGFGQRRGFRLEWPCPDCGVQISLTRSELRGLVHQPAVCRSCAADYCMSGRHRMSVVGRSARNGGCGPCYKEYKDTVVETRSCKGCEEPLEITRERLALMNAPSQKFTGEWHHTCYLKAGAGHGPGRKTHCKRGHELVDGNLYYWRNKRHCRACQLRRKREAYAAKKAAR